MKAHTDYKGIDIFKFIMAFAVVAIHAPEYLWPANRVYPEVFHWFIRLAVPFFFTVSGFLIQGKLGSIDNPTERLRFLRQRSLHIFRLWGIWLALYLPLTIYGELHSTTPLRDIIYRYIENALFTGRSLYAQSLWFIYVMAIVFFIWSLLERTKSIKALTIIFILFLVLELWKNTQPENNSTRTLGYIKYLVMLILGGGISMIGGALFRILLQQRTHTICLPISIISLCTSVVLYYYDISLFAFFGGLGVFILSLLFGQKLRHNLISLRQQSMWIFYTHMYVIIVFMIVMRQCHLSGNRWLLLSLVCLVSWCLASLLKRLSENPKFLKLKYLIK